MKQEKQKAGKVYKEGVTGTSLSHCCPAAAVPGPHSRCSGDLTSQQIQKETLEGISERQIFAAGRQPGTRVAGHCHPALGGAWDAAHQLLWEWRGFPAEIGIFPSGLRKTHTTRNAGWA